MSLTALSLTAVLPAAAGLAQSAVEAGGQLGGKFLDVLSGMTSRASKPESAPPIDSGQSAKPANLSLLTRAQSWSEKLMTWLSQHPATAGATGGDLQVQLSLDSLDQPHVLARGEGAEAVETALEQNPTWLQEFRELALDRSAELGGSSSGASGAAPLSLAIAQHEGEVQAAWQ